ncbi:FAD-binding oxidoreductase [Candidatus Pelagibacter sp.]|nr:FAD-binding oxidoreductase [Candidatus Pelagibacter sp.]
MKINAKKLNWGRNINVNPKIYYPKNLNDLKKINNKNFIIFGGGRSYGDTAVNKNSLVSLKYFNKIIKYDKIKGIIEVESGIILINLLKEITKDKWFVPVTPGSKYVSLGGMVANNVHGKNIKNNQLKHYINNIKLVTKTNNIINCSKKNNKKLFDLTIGGFGLTGTILTVTLKLKKVNSLFLNQKIYEFNGYNHFFSLSSFEKSYEYSVYWIDNFSKNKISGLNFLSKHSKKNLDKNIIITDKKINLFSYMILKLMISNYIILKVANFFYKKLNKYFYKKIENYNKVFYPQDIYTDWNKIYGNKGFFQIQILIPQKKFIYTMNKISLFFKKNDLFSTFIVIKKIAENGNYLNFYGKGYSISMDFKINTKKKVIQNYFHNLVLEENFRINLSKDSTAYKKTISHLRDYKNFKRDIKKYKKFSLFSERLL